ncbi:MAG TPA: hypothetical protein VJV05_09280 [Pyrinomonadaceae bacterium]|nr:hypothetical protein [Pyrinomonadaceae bacterium]
MRFARYTFLAAGTVGILVLAPMYFLIEKTGADSPPPINHPEFYYGFIGVALAFQLVFLMIATDPRKFRPLMLAGIVEKFAFVIPTFYLYLKGRVTGSIVGGAALDLIWGVLFVVSYFRVRDQRRSN